MELRGPFDKNAKRREEGKKSSRIGQMRVAAQKILKIKSSLPSGRKTIWMKIPWVESKENSHIRRRRRRLDI